MGPVCREVFDWARYGRTKGAVKLHLMLDHQGCLPSWVCITEGKVHDVTPVKALRLAPGTIVAMDRGDNDYALFGRWCEASVYFVTRLKSDAVYRVVDWRIAPLHGNILRDELIELDSIDRHPVTEVAAVALDLRLEPIESGRDA